MTFSSALFTDSVMRVKHSTRLHWVVAGCAILLFVVGVVVVFNLANPSVKGHRVTALSHLPLWILSLIGLLVMTCAAINKGYRWSDHYPDHCIVRVQPIMQPLNILYLVFSGVVATVILVRASKIERRRTCCMNAQSTKTLHLHHVPPPPKYMESPVSIA